MKEIKLTQGQVALVDDEDYEFLSQWKWYAIKDKTTFYAARAERKTTIQMHRVILGLTDSKIEGEHKDHNGCNNQRDNLRIATRSQNCANRPSFKNSSSKYLGVSWHKKNKKWVAYIRKDGLRKYIGSFNKEEDAALSYNSLAIQYFGDFANLNKVAV